MSSIPCVLPLLVCPYWLCLAPTNSFPYRIWNFCRDRQTVRNLELLAGKPKSRAQPRSGGRCTVPHQWRSGRPLLKSGCASSPLPPQLAQPSPVGLAAYRLDSPSCAWSPEALPCAGARHARRDVDSERSAIRMPADVGDLIKTPTLLESSGDATTPQRVRP